MKSHLRWILAGLLIGSVFFWLALKDIALAQVLAAIRHAGWPQALATLAAGFVFMALKGARWALLLRPVTTLESGFLHRSVYAGAAANLIVAHTGEVLRATLVARQTGASASAVLATIAVERVFDFAALAMLSTLAIALDTRVSPQLSSAALLGLAIVVVGIGAAYALVRAAPAAVRVSHVLLAPLPPQARDWLLRQLQRGRVGLEPLVDPKLAAKAAALSLLQWASIVAAIWTSSATVGVAPPLTAAVAVFVLMVIALTLPAPPAQLGTTQIAFVVGLGLVGVPAESAVAASLIYTGLIVVPVILIGGAIGLLSNWTASSSKAAEPRH